MKSLSSFTSSRRNFLKSSSLALAATVAVPAAAPTAARAEGLGEGQDDSIAPSGRAGSLASPVTLVNILQGTDSTPAFSRGNTLPIATRPFGMGHWTLESNPRGTWMFAPADRRLTGFRCTHQLSPWLGDYGHAVFLPFSGEVSADPGGRSSSYRLEDAKLSPHTMGLRLMRYSIDTELLPTERCAIITAKYEKKQTRGFIFDIPTQKDAPAPTVKLGKETKTISFTSTANSGGVQEGFATYYVLKFSAPWANADEKDEQDHHTGKVLFADDVEAIEVRIGTSFISFEQAERNIQLELGDKTPDALRKESEEVWNGYLKRIEIEGATHEQQQTFYSCLYRTLLFPRIWHEPDAGGKMQHRSVYNGKVVPGLMYADHGYWDVYRAWYPMMTILFPERLGEILQAWVNVYQEGGWLPQFPCPGYRACMTGSLIDSLFGEAAVKKIKGFDLETAYAGLKKHATQPGNPDKGYGRSGIESYLQYGYDPADKVGQSAAETTDAAYGDYCIAQVAKAVGKTEDYEMFLKRSENWRHIFDAQTGFLRGKKSDGSWLEPFDEFTWGDPYVEGGPWQHRWDVPHNMPALIEALGGKEKAVELLETMMTLPPTFNTGVYGYEIHEMSEMAALNLGQLAHNNQPVHHVLGVYADAGRQDRLAHWSHRVMNECYSPSGFSGDEDTGSMAAWYVMAALGIVTLCPGKPEYKLGSPLFAKATVHLPEGKTLVVESAAPEAHKTTLNGKPLSDATVDHFELIAGGKLRFS
ncbi:GH92 family glycosyl hydrolase [Silvibacterium dinghuense]|uniref:Glycoside hydrolase family 92 protein n=1 Tax=Silvibacterium dinghuense TaxID=1560006 RepID=A0A4Q1SHQ6_9BACT|nr:GH92 family glycosyl hydrolase [Silvibacterium dinghuense]RXS97096.1 glycoside hydrolase family 92 protein [Silvibacterium dinghuense]GGG96180.1 alpha-1 2-mannosidase [Silvibacterium dinghuense]